MDGREVPLADERLRREANERTELICRFRPDGTFTLINCAYQRCFGRPGRELVGSNLLDVLPEDERSAVLSHLGRLVSGERNLAQPREHWVIAGDGSTRWQRWVDHVTRDALGGVVEIDPSVAI